MFASVESVAMEKYCVANLFCENRDIFNVFRIYGLIYYFVYSYIHLITTYFYNIIQKLLHLVLIKRLI